LIKYDSRKIVFTNAQSLKQEGIFYRVLIDDFAVYKELLDKNLVSISSGDTPYSLESIKSNILSFLNSKTEKQQIGSIAELFSHVFFRELNYKQEFLYSNLEENSLKKGFDGLYSKDSKYWLVESKSTKTKGVLHKNRINDAIKDLSDKVSGKTTNDPFKNAVNHIKAVRDDFNKSLLKDVRKLSLDYSNGIYTSISYFNIIPTSTLFVDHTQLVDEIEKDLINIIDGKEFADIILVCIDNKVISDFFLYLKGLYI